MKKLKIIGIGIVGVLFYGCDAGEGTASVVEPETPMDGFAQCLTDAGARFYGTEWCSHCQAQKEMFGESMEFINFIDCDQNKAECQAIGITGYPTWHFNDKTKLPGRQRFQTLANKTGCEVPS